MSEAPPFLMPQAVPGPAAGAVAPAAAAAVAAFAAACAAAVAAEPASAAAAGAAAEAGRTELLAGCPEGGHWHQPAVENKSNNNKMEEAKRHLRRKFTPATPTW